MLFVLFLCLELMTFQDSVQIGLTLASVALGAGLAWIYWRRVEGHHSWRTMACSPPWVDAAFSLFVLIPRILWAA